MSTQFVWIFNGPKGKFPGGVFESLEIAENWIRDNRLTGVLTQYPLNIGSYDWAKANGLVTKRLETRADADFIGSFSSASFEHFHYTDGEKAFIFDRSAETSKGSYHSTIKHFAHRLPPDRRSYFE